MAGLASAVGLAIGGILLAILSASGLAVLFSESRTLFNVVSLAGGAYLLYLAIQMIRSAMTSVSDVNDAPSPVKQLPIRNIVYQGILVELLNPKTVLFYLQVQVQGNYAEARQTFWPVVSGIQECSLSFTGKYPIST